MNYCVVHFDSTVRKIGWPKECGNGGTIRRLLLDSCELPLDSRIHCLDEHRQPLDLEDILSGYVPRVFVDIENYSPRELHPTAFSIMDMLLPPSAEERRRGEDSHRQHGYFQIPEATDGSDEENTSLSKIVVDKLNSYDSYHSSDSNSNRGGHRNNTDSSSPRKLPSRSDLLLCADVNAVNDADTDMDMDTEADEENTSLLHNTNTNTNTRQKQQQQQQLRNRLTPATQKDKEKDGEICNQQQQQQQSDFRGLSFQMQMLKFTRILAHLVNERTVLAWFRMNLAFVSLSLKYLDKGYTYHSSAPVAALLLFCCGGLFVLLLPLSLQSGYRRYHQCKQYLDFNVAQLGSFLHQLGFDFDNVTLGIVVFASFAGIIASSFIIIWTSTSTTSTSFSVFSSSSVFLFPS